jgi:hypothetical protein
MLYLPPHCTSVLDWTTHTTPPYLHKSALSWPSHPEGLYYSQMIKCLKLCIINEAILRMFRHGYNDSHPTALDQCIRKIKVFPLFKRCVACKNVTQNSRFNTAIYILDDTDSIHVFFFFLWFFFFFFCFSDDTNGM